MCTAKEVQEIIEEYEIRMKKEMTLMEGRINDQMKETASNVLTPATITAMQAMKEDFLGIVKGIDAKLDTIYPHTLKEIERQKAYDLVKGEINKGSGYMKWLLGSLLTFGALSGYLQTFLKWFLQLK
jgi:hypothetical protein